MKKQLLFAGIEMGMGTKDWLVGYIETTDDVVNFVNNNFSGTSTETISELIKNNFVREIFRTKDGKIYCDSLVINSVDNVKDIVLMGIGRIK